MPIAVKIITLNKGTINITLIKESLSVLLIYEE